MNRNLIMIIVGVIAIGVVLVVVFATKTGSPIPVAPSSSGEKSVTITPHLVSAMPADAPSGNMMSLQGSDGVVAVKNFYKTAAGYWPEMDAVAIESTVPYTIWYYRASGSFEIAVSSAGTKSDEAAAEQKLMSDLGIDRKTFCSLSVSASYQPDNGTTYKQDLPVSSCMNAF